MKAKESTSPKRWLALYNQETEITTYMSGLDRLRYLPRYRQEYEKQQRKLDRVRRQMLNLGRSITQEQFEEELQHIVCHSWEDFREDYERLNQK